MRTFFALAVLTGLTATASAQIQHPNPPSPFPYNREEPVAEAFSLARSGEYLDQVARNWMGADSCGSCHAKLHLPDGPGPLLKDVDGSAVAEARRHLERRITGATGERFPNAFQSEVLTTALALAFHDARTTGQLRPMTRHVLDRMWKLQRTIGRNAGAWGSGCIECPPAETDSYYSAALAAVAVGIAPEKYAETPAGPGRPRPPSRVFQEEPRRGHPSPGHAALGIALHRRP